MQITGALKGVIESVRVREPLKNPKRLLSISLLK